MPAGTAGVRLLPNAITVLALCAGLTSVQYALSDRYAFAVAAIAVAAVLDAVDGRLARKLDAASKTGAELDSLADAVSFGVAPALVLYIWALSGGRAGWAIALVFAVCTVLRLARFNTLLDVDRPVFTREFFVGVPAPVGGLLALVPVVVWLQAGSGWWSSTVTVACWTLLIAFLMISRLPTLSFKRIRVPPRAVLPLLLVVLLTAAVVVSYPAQALMIALVAYVAHLPYAAYRYRWLESHPEAWEAPSRQRRAIRRARSARRRGARPPLRRRVAGAAVRASAAVRRRRNGNGDNGQLPGVAPDSTSQSTGQPTAHPPLRPPPAGQVRRRRRLGLRRPRR